MQIMATEIIMLLIQAIILHYKIAYMNEKPIKNVNKVKLNDYNILILIS